MLETIIIVAIAFYCGYKLGGSIAAYKLSYLLLKEAGEKNINLESLSAPKTPSIHKLEIETINDILYLYVLDKEEFICQGKTLEELADIALKYKNIKYAVVLYNDKIYSFTDGKLNKKYES